MRSLHKAFGIKMIEIDEKEYGKVPPDFPFPVSPGAISGVQPEHIISEYNGKCYSLGCTPTEIYERWNECVEIAQMLAFAANRSKIDKMTLKSETEILLEYSELLSKMSWLSRDEVKWIVRKVGQLLSWPVPS